MDLVSPEAVLLDLDGTLLDTAPDLGGAVNMLLEQYERTPMPLDALRPYVSQGGLTLVSIAFELDRQSERAHQLWQEYLLLYQQRISRNTQLFNGMGDVLEALEVADIPWGVVTNKPEYLTHPLLRDLDLDTRAACIVGGDTLNESKPSPAPVLHACEAIGIPAGRAIMVGDDERDIVSGKAAGAGTVAAGWGYIQPEDSPASWSADRLMSHPLELLTLFE